MTWKALVHDLVSDAMSSTHRWCCLYTTRTVVPHRRLATEKSGRNDGVCCDCLAVECSIRELPGFGDDCAWYGGPRA